MFLVEGEGVNVAAMGGLWGGAEVEYPDNLSEISTIWALGRRGCMYHNHGEEDEAGSRRFIRAI